MDYKCFRLSELKAAADSPGQFTGFAAIHGTIDRNGEIIDRGAMTRSINASDGEFPLLWQHQYNSILGVVKLQDTERGAKAVGQINTTTALGGEVYQQMLPPPGFTRGAIRDMSIGYIVHKDQVIDGVRHLKEIQLLEVSLVTVAAHPKTFVTNVKEVDAQAVRISQLEHCNKTIIATLIEEGLISDPERFHSLLGVSLDGPGKSSDDPGNAHSPEYQRFVKEMQMEILRKALSHERDCRNQVPLGGNPAAL